jgi:hypothetical protein
LGHEHCGSYGCTQYTTTVRADLSRRHGQEVREMAGRNTRQTSAKVAKAASKVLSNPKSSKAAKSAAASALSQAAKRK